MRRAAALAAALALAAAGCRHARRAGPEQERGGTAAAPEGGLPARPGRPPVPASPAGLLGRDELRDVQRALAGRGLLGEHDEGTLDPPTAAAVRRFQEDQGLAATGFPDRKTLQLLGIDPERAYRKARRRARTGEPDHHP